jgi:kynurenine 3-monooxygenase
VLRKKLAVMLHATFPHWYLPLYTMIEFSRIPYADAQRRSRLQARIVTVAAVVVLAALVGVIVLLGRLL